MLFDEIEKRLVVSCQALPDEPLYSAFIMGRMARAAKEGGAAAIRAQSVVDITEIKKVTGLPVIGLIKRDYADSEIYITPTRREVAELLTTACEVIALDMTDRPRPQGTELSELVAAIHAAGRLVLADISSYAEGMAAARLGADAVSTTLSGYTPYSPQLLGPDIGLVEKLAASLDIPVLAEGRIHTAADMRAVMAAGAWAPVVGSAITRPQLITADFVRAMQ